MRVAIDARLLTGAYTGDRTYWRGLLKALIRQLEGSAHRLVLFSARPLPPEALPPSPVWESVVIPARSERWWSLWHFPRAAQRYGCHVAHMQYTVSPLFRIPAITTVHDISFLIAPEWFGWKDRWLLRLTVPPSCRRAARVLTVSETSREDMIRYLHLPPDKVVATPNGVPEGFYPIPKDEAQAWVRQQYGIEPPFALAVGVLQPRKNWGLAIRAVAYYREQSGNPLKLVLTGKPGWAEASVKALCAELEAESWVHFTGYVPDEHLVWLYNASEMLLYPSFYEGFGLPPLEAMACGVPVIASNGGALPEVVGSGGILLPPTEYGMWAYAIQTLMENEAVRAQIRERALQQAQRFRWETTAERTWAVYEQAACASG
ncbi:MAG: glycosyltransferase family 4 protein [Armatimonadetes bacterium]|nr:glycosyltransferase family 4 protein [Armatimonadota bacterium]